MIHCRKLEFLAYITIADSVVVLQPMTYLIPNCQVSEKWRKITVITFKVIQDHKFLYCHVPRRLRTSRSISSNCFVGNFCFGSVSVSEYDSFSYYYIQHDHTFASPRLHMHLSACNSTSPLSAYDFFYIARHATFHCPLASMCRGDWPLRNVAPLLTRRAASSQSHVPVESFYATLSYSE